MIKRNKNFEMFYDECETNILRLLREYNITFAVFPVLRGYMSKVSMSLIEKKYSRKR